MVGNLSSQTDAENSHAKCFHVVTKYVISVSFCRFHNKFFIFSLFLLPEMPWELEELSILFLWNPVLSAFRKGESGFLSDATSFRSRATSRIRELTHSIFFSIADILSGADISAENLSSIFYTTRKSLLANLNSSWFQGKRDERIHFCT